VVFLAGNLFGSNGRYYRPAGDDFGAGLIRQARFYLVGIFRGEPHPYEHSSERKFNPLQKVAYLVVMFVIFPAIVVTGWCLFFPERMPERMWGAPGVAGVAVAHAAIGYALSLFMVGHMYLGTTGDTPGALFRAMLTGYASHAKAHGESAAG
jgi:thiosulfate reductase cytochrome b subunit